MYLLSVIGEMLKASQVLLVLCLLSLSQIASGADDKTFSIAVYNKLSLDPIVGIYAIRKHIIESRGYKLEYKVVPSQRMPYSLNNGSIDSISVSELARSTRQIEKPDGFLQAEYPDRVTVVHIYYKNENNWVPNWPADDFFKKKVRGVSINYNYLKVFGFDVAQIPGYFSGVNMVNYGRADYWIDAIPSYSPTFNAYKKPEHQGYIRNKLLDSPLFLLFADTDKGRLLKSIMDEGLRKLLLDPEKFREIYMQGIDLKTYTGSMEEYLHYMKRTYSEFNQINYLRE